MTQGPLIRVAELDEAETLTGLCMRSKAMWGYDAVFLDQCRALLTLTPDYIRQHGVYVADEKGTAIGLYALVDEGAFVDVDLFFIEPNCTRRGVGRALWKHMVVEARRYGRERLQIISDPFAVPFYRAMGAEPVGETPNGLQPGRMLPVLEVRLPAS